MWKPLYCWDSEDRLVATTEKPAAMVGEFACLKVVSVNPRVGAFLDWGLSKDLLLPFREQDGPVRVGQKVIVYVYVDAKSNRVVPEHNEATGDQQGEKSPARARVDEGRAEQAEADHRRQPHESLVAPIREVQPERHRNRRRSGRAVRA